MSALMAGLLVLPAVVVNAIMGVIGGRIMDSHGAWPLIPVGVACIVAGQVAISPVAGSLGLPVVVLLTALVYGGASAWRCRPRRRPACLRSPARSMRAAPRS